MGISAPLASAFKAKKGFGLYGRPPCLPKTKINGKANKNKKESSGRFKTINAGRKTKTHAWLESFGPAKSIRSGFKTKKGSGSIATNRLTGLLIGLKR